MDNYNALKERLKNAEEMTVPQLLDKIAGERGKEKTRISEQDIIYAQTFPEDYDFGEKKWDNVAYICGMSVPPVMIKRIVGRIIDTGIFKERKYK